MSLSSAMLAVAFLFAAPVPPSTDQERLQGTWNVVTAVANGQVAPGGVLKDAKVLFAGNKMTLISFNREEGVLKEDRREFSFTLDPSKKPKAIDVKAVRGVAQEFLNKTNPAIYSLEGDTLKLCLPNKTTTQRPTEFKSEKGSDLILMELKKAK